MAVVWGEGKRPIREEEKKRRKDGEEGHLILLDLVIVPNPTRMTTSSSAIFQMNLDGKIFGTTFLISPLPFSSGNRINLALNSPKTGRQYSWVDGGDPPILHVSPLNTTINQLILNPGTSP